MKPVLHGIISVRHITDFSCFGTLDNTSALYLGAVASSEVTDKRHINVKSIALDRLQERVLSFSIRAETQRQGRQVQLGICAC
jgi:hypothetical protein